MARVVHVLPSITSFLGVFSPVELSRIDCSRSTSGMFKTLMPLYGTAWLWRLKEIDINTIHLFALRLSLCGEQREVTSKQRGRWWVQMYSLQCHLSTLLTPYIVSCLPNMLLLGSKLLSPAALQTRKEAELHANHRELQSTSTPFSTFQ